MLLSELVVTVHAVAVVVVVVAATVIEFVVADAVKIVAKEPSSLASLDNCEGCNGEVALLLLLVVDVDDLLLLPPV